MSLSNDLSKAWHDFIHPSEAERPIEPSAAEQGQARPSGDCHPVGKLENGNTLWECESGSEASRSLAELADSFLSRFKSFFSSGLPHYTAGIRGRSPRIPVASSPAPISGGLPPKAPSRTSK